MIDLCISCGFCEIYLFDHIAKLKIPRFGIDLIALAGLEAMMIALLSLLEFSEYFLEASFADALLGFRSDLDFPLLIVFSDITLFFQLVNKIAHPILFI